MLNTGNAVLATAIQLGKMGLINDQTIAYIELKTRPTVCEYCDRHIPYKSKTCNGCGAPARGQQ